MTYSRRSMLTSTLAVLGAGSLTGCLDDATPGVLEAAGDTTSVASFFVFGDIADQVAGETADSNLLVPVGQHGHGWEPGPQIREDIQRADVLFTGTPGFQPWVDQISTDLDTDAAGVRAVDVSNGVTLLGATHGDETTHDDGHDDEDGHDETTHDEHDDDDGHDETTHDEHDDDDGHDETTHDEHDDDDGHDETTHDDEGGNDETTHHDDDGHDETTHDDEDGHDHAGDVDPHFWLDPLRVKAAVDTVEHAFSDVDDENAAAYAANADTYRDDLDALHDQIENTVDAGSGDVVLFAGHDAFGYLADRYDLHVEALAGLSPDDRPTIRDVERAQAVIAEHDLRYVCADPLSAQRAAEQLVAETDAEAVLPLTAIPGIDADWDDDWGYVDVMTNVNLPTLERVLDAR